MKIHIKNLRLQTVVGIQAWERKTKQDVVINIHFEFDGSEALKTDHIQDTIDYKSLKKRVIKQVEASQFYLLEKLASSILDIVMDDPKVVRASVEVDKPQALRFADSVSVECSEER
ncbi:dihydroneopterin aldolase [bacterium]|nr:dihydroneopterin aldolase [bacterium]